MTRNRSLSLNFRRKSQSCIALQARSLCRPVRCSLGFPQTTISDLATYCVKLLSHAIESWRIDAEVVVARQLTDCLLLSNGKALELLNRDHGMAV